MSEESIDRLYQRFAPVVFRRARQLLDGDESAAWDAVQEVFMRIMRSRDDFRNEASPMTWIYRITTNYCLNVIRDGSRRRAGMARHAAQPRAQAAQSPEQRIATAQLLAQLPEDLCEIAVYAWVDRMSQEEIADVVGLSRKTVAARLKQFQATAQELLQPAEAQS
jgi:RNA polymerase sigma-70 factor (ECF subfamily)